MTAVGAVDVADADDASAGDEDVGGEGARRRHDGAAADRDRRHRQAPR